MSMHAKRSQMKKRIAVGSLRLTAKMQGSQQSRLPSKNGDIAPKIKRKDRKIIIRICVRAKKKSGRAPWEPTCTSYSTQIVNSKNSFNKWKLGSGRRSNPSALLH